MLYISTENEDSFRFSFHMRGNWFLFVCKVSWDAYISPLQSFAGGGNFKDLPEIFILIRLQIIPRRFFSDL